MLNKRTHILFDEKTFKLLEDLSVQKNASIGELVRKAVKETYDSESILERKRKEIIQKIIKTKKPRIIPYKARDFVAMGRKFEE